MTNEEEIKIRMGFDATALDRGTVAMLERQKKYQMDYVSSWEKMLATRDAAESASNEASLARLKTNLEVKAALQKEFFAEQEAQIAIGKGGGAFASIESVAGGAAAGRIAGAGLREAGHEAHGFAGILRETAVLFREGFRGNFTRMIGSASLLIGMLGTLAAAVAIPLAAILAIPGLRAWQAHKAEEESGKRLQEKVDFLAEGQRAKVKELAKFGLLSASEARGYESDLAHPDSDSLNRIIGETNQLQKQLDLKKQEAEHAKAVANATKDREESEKIIAEQKERQARAEAAISAEYASAAREGRNIRTAWNRLDESVPTLGDLAGRNFTNNLNRQYGRGGRFDLGRGAGPFAAAAQESELAADQMIYDLKYGNGSYVTGPDGIGHFTGQAELDRQRKISANNLLGAAGLDTPEQKMEEMKQHMKEISDKMSGLLYRADQGGIPVRIPSQ